MINSADSEYLAAVRQVLSVGENKSSDIERTGTGTISLFGDVKMRFDLREGFPLLTTKRVWFHGVIGELIWFLSGSNDVRWLQHHRIRIWDEWQKEDGTIGPGTYGQLWRGFQGVDQISALIEGIKTNPHSRRHIVTAWDPSINKDAALPPCHFGFQVYVSPCGHMDMSYWMRSNDLFLGAPFNIASYAALLHVLCEVTGYSPRFLTHHVVGDAHIYENHLEQVEIQLEREHRAFKLPILQINGISKESDLRNLDFDNFQLSDYHCHPAIVAPIAV